jgi:tetratricopeptide (TPR) repeat protein
MTRTDEAIATARRAQTLDPLSPAIGTNMAQILYGARRYDEAIAEARKTLRFSETFPLRCVLGSRGEKGMHDQAVDALKEAVAIRRQSELSGVARLHLWRIRASIRCGEHPEGIGRRGGPYLRAAVLLRGRLRRVGRDGCGARMARKGRGRRVRLGAISERRSAVRSRSSAPAVPGSAPPDEPAGVAGVMEG